MLLEKPNSCLNSLTTSITAKIGGLELILNVVIKPIAAKSLMQICTLLRGLLYSVENFIDSFNSQGEHIFLLRSCYVSLWLNRHRFAHFN